MHLRLQIENESETTHLYHFLSLERSEPFCENFRERWEKRGTGKSLIALRMETWKEEKGKTKTENKAYNNNSDNEKQHTRAKTKSKMTTYEA